MAGCAFLPEVSLDERLDLDGDGVPRPTDCDDTDPLVTALTFFADADGDGYGSDVEVQGCSPAEGYATVSGDCSDERAEAYPGAPEICNRLDDDCDGEADEDIEIPIWSLDGDHDGYGNLFESVAGCERPSDDYTDNSEDCDDNDARVNPDGEEICNGVDDDCDGLTDDADPDAPLTTWYRDADIDGFGDPELPFEACVVPIGFVGDATDCDDSDAAINPEGIEVCSGVDEDCDGLVDDADADTPLPIWYHDSDGDGYGGSSRSVESCEPPTDFVAGDTDCDDADDTNYPGAEERCDGIDNDCDLGTGEDGVVTLDDSLNQPTIQAAIDSASDGSTVQVCDGTYIEALTISVGLTLTSRGGADVTTIDGGGDGSTISIDTPVDVYISGFTITGGSGTDRGSIIGGGIDGYFSSGLSITDCQIEGNTADYGGGLITSLTGLTQLTDTTFFNNEATVSGGGVYIGAGGVDMVGTTVTANSAVNGGGLFLDDTEATLDSASEVTSNTASTAGGGAYLSNSDLYGGVNANNRAEYGAGILVNEGANQLSDVAIEDNVAFESGG